MSSCEKCWTDAHYYYGDEDVAEAYAKLIAERADSPCTPEQQAGPDASWCTACGRRTRHQYTNECLVPGCSGWDANGSPVS